MTASVQLLDIPSKALSPPKYRCHTTQQLKMVNSPATKNLKNFPASKDLLLTELRLFSLPIFFSNTTCLMTAPVQRKFETSATLSSTVFSLDERQTLAQNTPKKLEYFAW
jgi:hypothetical protein